VEIKHVLLVLAVGAIVVLLLPRRQQSTTTPTPRIHLRATQPPLAQQVTYQNKEEWEIKRDGAGMIQGIVIHREVTRNE